MCHMKKYSKLFLLFLTFLALSAFEADAEVIVDPPSAREVIGAGPDFDEFAVKGFISSVSNSFFEFNHENYKEKLGAIKDFFSTAGFRSFYGAMNETGFLKSIISKKQTIHGYIISPIQISEPKIVRSTFFWTSTFNYVIEYSSEGSTLFQFLKISVDIKEIPSGEDRGKRLAVDRWLSFIDEDPIFCPCHDGGKQKKNASLHDALKDKMGLEEDKDGNLGKKEEDSSGNGEDSVEEDFPSKSETSAVEKSPDQDSIDE